MAAVSWEGLKSGIEAAFSTDRVDVDEVKRLLTSYRSDQEDWGQFANFDPHRSALARCIVLRCTHSVYRCSTV